MNVRKRMFPVRTHEGAVGTDMLERVIQRADELDEFVALYWKKRKEPRSRGVKRGLANAFTSSLPTS